MPVLARNVQTSIALTWVLNGGDPVEIAKQYIQAFRASNDSDAGLSAEQENQIIEWAGKLK